MLEMSVKTKSLVLWERERKEADGRSGNECLSQVPSKRQSAVSAVPCNFTFALLELPTCDRKNLWVATEIELDKEIALVPPFLPA
jgi:hypothetical protein